MNNSELDKILKSAVVFEHTETYWAAFPQRVMAKIHRHSTREQPGTKTLASGWLLFTQRRCFIGLCLIVVGIAAGFSLGQRHSRPDFITKSQLAGALKCYQEIQTLFPNQVRAIVFNGQAASLELAERPEVPASAPIFLRIANRAGRQDIVTFSGQAIQFNGERCDVLLDRQGHIILAGWRWVWSSEKAEANNPDVLVAARLLEDVL